MIYLRKIFVVIVALCTFTQTVLGTPETYTNRVSSSDFTSGFTFEVIDGRFAELDLDHFKDKGTSFILKLGIDERTDYDYITAYTFSVDVLVQGFNEDFIPLTPETITLTVDYSPESGLTTDLNYFKGLDGYRYLVTVDPIAAPANIYLEGELTIDRFYDIDAETIPLTTSLGCHYIYIDPSSNIETVFEDVNTGMVPINAGQELEIWWDYIEGAERYELEWTWVDNYGNTLADIDALGDDEIDFTRRDFELNNTRIITSAQSYRIPLIYAEGYLLYRVRGVGVWTDNDLQDTHIRKYSSWSNETSEQTTVDTWPHRVELTRVEQAIKNWQYQAVYAEQGKKKEIISYFDGSLRNRQTVTRINSNKEAIVGENVYDNQGRSAIQILPTPVGNSALRYYPQLNKNMSDIPYSHADFDWDQDDCISEVEPMTNGSGASKYYSQNNTVTGNWQDYVPDAKNYPFVQVQYTPDNTGRVRSQSGVGPYFKIDGEQATKYFYLQPFQEELDRLFGYQVGYKSRYKKNLVVDANGQVSVSYLDPQGRVIATALAGTNTTGTGETESLESLDEHEDGNHGLMSVDLLNKYGVDCTDTDLDDNERFSTGVFGALTDGLRFGTQLGCPEDNIYSFNYRVRTGVFTDDCMPAGKGYPFAYDLTIDIKDDCGQTVIPGAEPITDLIVGTTETSYTSPLGADVTHTFAPELAVGAYSVSKFIKINEEKLDEYVADFLENNTCLLTFDDFFEDNVDCEDDLPVEDLIDITSCYVTERMLLGDLSPMGQYGATDGEDPLSIFTEINALQQGNLSLATEDNWRYPASPYLNPDGSAATAFDDGEETELTALVLETISLIDFLASWKSSYAKSLVAFHPEYCYVEYADAICTQTALVDGVPVSSENYNNALQTIMTYDDAVSDNDLGVDLIGTPYGVGEPSLKSNDPYFGITYSVINTATEGAGNSLKDELMDEIMSNYKGSTRSMWQLCVQVVVAGTDLDGDYLDLSVVGFSALLPVEKNQIWNTYKNFYLAEKRKVDQLFIDMHAIRNGCYNNYIGEDYPSTPSLMAFSDYPGFVVPVDVDPGESISELYADAIADAPVGDLPFPWMDGPYTGLFSEKVARFMRIDNLYDAGIDEYDMMETLADYADANMYEFTGKCAYALDVELFLNGMAQNGLFVPSTTDSDLLPEFTADLYVEMGGTLLEPGDPAALYPANIVTSAMGDDLKIQVTNTTDGSNLPKNIKLEKPAAYVSWGWSDVIGMEMFYYVPNSLLGGVYSFEVLAIADIAGDTVEVVIEGTTKVQVGECTYPTPCPRANDFANQLGAIYYQLHSSDEIGGITAVSLTPLTSHIGDWYAGTELYAQLSDFDEDATISSEAEGAGNNIIITSDTRRIDVFFDTEPTDIVAITGSTYNPDDNTLTIYYIDDDGENQFFTGDVSFEAYPSGTALSFDFDCDCRDGDEDLLLDRLETLCNFVIGYYDSHPTNVSPDYPIYSEVDAPILAIDGIMDFIDSELDDELSDFGIWWPNSDATATPILEADAFGFDFSQAGICGIEFKKKFVGPAVLTDLVSISDLTIVSVLDDLISLEAIGTLSDGSTVVLEAIRVPCFAFIPCDNCVPQTVAPQSCNDQWTAYQAIIDDFNAFIDGEPDLDVDEDGDADGADLFPSYSEDDFCETNLAYAVESYLYYLSTFDIETPDDLHYITMSEFVITDLNMGYYYYDDDTDIEYDMTDVIDAYETYLGLGGELNWNIYVAEVYLIDNPAICPPNPMPINFDYQIEFPCEMFTANTDTVNAMNDYATYLENTIANFKQRYIEEAISDVVENFDLGYPDKEYHYTLYYYDQAGNLIQTVPPKGVDRFETSLDQDEIKDARLDHESPTNAVIPGVLPDHKMETKYKYNSLNQLVYQTTPDGGESYFAYDDLGRLVVSQNAKQKYYAGDLYSETGQEQFSYTKYDGLGRIIEVGEMTVIGDYVFNENGQLLNMDEAPEDQLVDIRHTDFPTNLVGFTSREEVTRTKYDEMAGADPSDFADYSADNTRNRITGVFYFESPALLDDFDDYDNATFYDYDVHGNVKEIIQDNQDSDLDYLAQTTKKIAYDYDLVSGNVKEVTYQKNELDQFIHEYEYDADNRITNVRTSRDEVVWEQDAKYFYYNHGPLGRTEVGDKKVHSSDYAYTIQGWLKGVNSENLDATKDQGKDSDLGINRMNGKDVFGYSLHYFQGDYQGRLSNDFLAYSFGTVLPDNSNLYNGNIREMYTASTNTVEANIGTSHTVYLYDQLNRIANMEQEHLAGVATPGHTALTGKYESNYTYDSNGNLMTLNRWAKDDAGDKTHIDEFTYNYEDPNNNNRLAYVHDARYDLVDGPGSSVLSDESDLASQTGYHLDGNPLYAPSTSNYHYDKIGQLIHDKQEEIAEIKWKVTGKVHKIMRELGSSKDNLEFVYDAMGNRIMKIVTDNSGALLSKTYYIRDAQGNVMSIYNLTNPTPNSKELKLTERNIYGSSRVGTENPDQVVATYSSSGIGDGDELTLEQTVGDRRYELSNHLGNVLEVVTDRKLAVDENTYDLITGVFVSAVPDGVVDYYVADVVSQSDYYPFGMLMPNRNESGDEYRYGFQGSEMDNEVKESKGTSYTTYFRQLDPRIGRWLSNDPKISSDISPYVVMNNNPIYSNDVLGDDAIGLDKKSARRAKRNIRKSFRGRGSRHIRKLIQLEDDGVTFTKIDPKQFEMALMKKGVTSDQRALARGYFKSINSTSTTYHIGVKKLGEEFIDSKTVMATAGPSSMTNYIKNSKSTGAVVDYQDGGGVTTTLKNGKAKDVYVLIVKGSKANVSDYRNVNTGKSINGKSSKVGELIAHEMLGHGLAYEFSEVGFGGSAQSVQMSNLWLRLKGKNRYRDGSSHGDTVKMSKKKANEIPYQLR